MREPVPCSAICTELERALHLQELSCTSRCFVLCSFLPLLVPSLPTLNKVATMGMIDVASCDIWYPAMLQSAATQAVADLQRGFCSPMWSGSLMVCSDIMVGSVTRTLAGCCWMAWSKTEQQPLSACARFTGRWSYTHSVSSLQVCNSMPGFCLACMPSCR